MNRKVYESMKRVIAGITVVVMCISLMAPVSVSAEWGMKNSKKTFYSLDIDSLDVLFVGSSVSAAAVNPYQLYEEQGIHSYNLAGVAEPMNSTYFWLKEALRTQNPKVVFIEVQTAIRRNKKKEDKARKNFDWMRYGLTKIQFAIEYCSSDEEVKLADYLLPVNWKEFISSFILKPDTSYLPEYKSITKGFSAQTLVSGIKYEGIELDTETYTKEYYKPYYEYLARAIKLCKEKNIDVVLYKTPTRSWTSEKHNLIKRRAEEYKISFIDFNLKDLMKEIDFVYSSDSDDGMHVNMNGAKKISSYLASYINENYNLEDIRNTDEAKTFEDDKEEFDLYMSTKQAEMEKN